MAEIIKTGIIGLGFIGMLHLDALTRVPGVEIVAVCDGNEEHARKTAEKYHIPKYSSDWRQLTEDPDIDVIHDCTPHFLHDEINRSAILNGKHIYGEKPLSLTLEGGREIWRLAEEHHVAHGLNHQYRMNAAVLEMRCRLQSGEAGKPLFVFGRYLQESGSRSTDFSQRFENTGKARCINDIGIHFIDTACSVLQSPVTAVMANLVTHFPIRTDSNGQQHIMDTEDTGSILLKFANGVTGCFVTSKAANGHMNDLQINVACENYAMEWRQETTDHLFIGEKNIGTTEMYMNPKLVHEEVRPYIIAPMGHTMGWPDALRNALMAYYQSVRDGSYRNENQLYSTFRDGVLGLAFIDACIESSRLGHWVEVEQP